MVRTVACGRGRSSLRTMDGRAKVDRPASHVVMLIFVQSYSQYLPGSAVQSSACVIYHTSRVESVVSITLIIAEPLHAEFFSTLDSCLCLCTCAVILPLLHLN